MRRPSKPPGCGNRPLVLTVRRATASARIAASHVRRLGRPASVLPALSSLQGSSRTQESGARDSTRRMPDSPQGRPPRTLVLGSPRSPGEGSGVAETLSYQVQTPGHRDPADTGAAGRTGNKSAGGPRGSPVGTTARGTPGATPSTTWVVSPSEAVGAADGGRQQASDAAAPTSSEMRADQASADRCPSSISEVSTDRRRQLPSE